MDITIVCQISLSKKLRALIGNNETTVTMVTNGLKDGKGTANMVISLDNISKKDLEDLMNKETSIMITPVSATEGIVSGSQAVTNIFSNESIDEGDETPVSKIAATVPPSKKGDVRYSIKSKQVIDKEIPEAFKEINKPEVKRFIMDLESLMGAVRASENKSYNVDIDSIKDVRKKAVAMEEKERAEAIDYPAYVVNDKCANLTINDLGINLMLNMPFNLSNISAKRLAASKDLKSMFRAGMVKFIHPDDISEYEEKAKTALQNPGLETFSNHQQAEAAIMNSRPDTEPTEVSLDDIDNPTEQEILASNMLNRSSQIEESEGIRRSTHGNTLRRNVKTVPTEKTNAAKSTIRRTGIEYR